MKATAIAPSNIAFIKYWGRKDETLKLPTNGSISMNLSHLLTTTTVEFDHSLSEDSIVISNSSLKNERSQRDFSSLKASRNDNKGNDQKAIDHLNRIRKLAGLNEKARVVSENNFPKGTGLSSSASGFAALTVAGAKAAGLDLSERELSILARQGSGSACRSIPDGFTEWFDGDTSEDSFAVSLYPPSYWDIVAIVVVLTDRVKDVSTTDGQRFADTSPFFAVRQEMIKDKIAKIKTYLKDKSFQSFGKIVEAEALELHAIMLTSNPSLIYWYPETITVMKAVQKWRSEGLQCYFTLNTGQNIHVICEAAASDEVTSRLQALSLTKKLIHNVATHGARVITEHLF